MLRAPSTISCAVQRFTALIPVHFSRRTNMAALTLTSYKCDNTSEKRKKMIEDIISKSILQMNHIHYAVLSDKKSFFKKKCPACTGKEGGETRHAAPRRTETQRGHATRASPEDRSADREDKTPPNVALPHHYYTLSSTIFKSIVSKSQNEKVAIKR